MNFLQQAQASIVNYAKVRDQCTLRIVTQDAVDISVIIPCGGRREFNHPLTEHMERAFRHAAQIKLGKTFALTFVEHSEEPEHEALCYNWVNYIWIPKRKDRFNKCLAYNIGVLYSAAAKHYLLHDIDTLPPYDFFGRLLQNMHEHNALQAFTKRRLLYASESISRDIRSGKIRMENLTDSTPGVKAGEGRASGGSIFCERDLFFKVGGYDPEFFTEYSVEDQFFFDKLDLCGKLGFCNKPPIEMVHLYHEPGHRKTKQQDFDAIHAYKELSATDKQQYIHLKSEHIKKYMTNPESLRSRPRIRIIDNQFGHAPSFGCGDLNLKPSYFDWYRGSENINNIVVITDTCFDQVSSCKETMKIGLIVEPPQNNTIYREIIKPELYEKFDVIFTYNKNLLSVNHRFNYFPYGGCWIYPDDRRIYDKTKGISIIASNKKLTEGHRLRHAVIDKYGSRLDGIYGNGYKKVQNKLEALRDFRFSIIIENDDCPGWFTEKLIDCFLTGTIPIFWGCPDIGEYFNMAGILTFETEGELANCIDSAIDPELYAALQEAVQDNFIRAQQYAMPEDWLWKHFFSAFY